MRKTTKTIKIGDKLIGGCNPILIQSMTNIKTSKVDLVIKQIKELESNGCDIVRVSVLDMDDAKAIKEIKKNISIPLVADIHFDYKLAIESINSGCDKIRLNPGNIENIDHVKEVVNLCKEKHIPIRIGVNAGSLPKDLELNAENMVKALKRHIDILEALEFYDICISLKANDINLCVNAYKLASKNYDYPVHIGITEAGLEYSGLVKSSIGLGILLYEGIGDTIRVSLATDPVKEVIAAKEILSNMNLYDKATLTVCPTCGRTEYDLIPLATKINEYIKNIKKPLKLAVMGCVVNGIGEAKYADLAICGGKNKGVIISHGNIIKTVDEANLYTEFINELNKLI
ncbi:MAG: flavodoxin-dependent (E)-4-hydroxy-3-methylbut-2-enyl-diphosphate synthase [bacterium]|nr:flavodoxin-dependent (E)-4-hydroxy-3-methylbut-2-enyl-diphosphate synthase [bacterium]